MMGRPPNGQHSRRARSSQNKSWSKLKEIGLVEIQGIEEGWDSTILQFPENLAAQVLPSMVYAAAAPFAMQYTPPDAPPMLVENAIE